MFNVCVFVKMCLIMSGIGSSDSAVAIRIASQQDCYVVVNANHLTKSCSGASLFVHSKGASSCGAPLY